MKTPAILRLCTLVVSMALISSCDPARGSIHFVSLSPETSKRLEEGAVVTIRVKATYELIGKQGSAWLFVQNGTDVLKKEVIELETKSGDVSFETAVLVPRSRKLEVNLALFESGEETSVVNERLEYIINSAEQWSE